MPRRGHKKSRAGCEDCKRRHVKCDESRPSCVNCRVASLKCSYMRRTELPQSAVQSSLSTPAYSPLTPDAGATVTTGINASSTSSSLDEPLNLDHLELLHHFESWTYESFSTNSKVAVSYRDTAVSHGLRFPFLMYAILAVSAMHLGRLRPERADHYRSLASSLQAVGLAGLKDNLLNINKDNVVAVFIFSTTTGLHSFCDTFSFRDLEFNQFLDKLTGTIRLMRGVRSVMNGGWWEHLRTTELADLLAAGSILDHSYDERGVETESLWELLSVADLGHSSVKIYEDTVMQLQKVFIAEAKLEHVEGSVSMVFAWPVIVSAEYNELLIQRRPEALIILAYYGVILHHRREAWPVGDAGRYLIRSVSNYLGKHWERWLVWPNTAISATTPITTHLDSS